MSIELYNTTSSGPVNTKCAFNSEEFRFHLVSWISLLVEQHKILDTLKAIIKYLHFYRKKRLSRKLLSKITGLHPDTISAHNVLLEENQILNIQRRFKEVNIYSSEFILILAEVFGFATPMESRSAFLFTDHISKTINNNVAERENMRSLDHNPEMSEQTVSKLKDFMKTLVVKPTCILSV